jgi:hypothetical protein
MNGAHEPLHVKAAMLSKEVANQIDWDPFFGVIGLHIHSVKRNHRIYVNDPSDTHDRRAQDGWVALCKMAHVFVNLGTRSDISVPSRVFAMDSPDARLRSACAHLMFSCLVALKRNDRQLFNPFDTSWLVSGLRAHRELPAGVWVFDKVAAAVTTEDFCERLYKHNQIPLVPSASR